ncbi:MAG: amidase, partial [Paracoccaceae bacterium]
ILDEAIARLERLNPRLNAVIETTYDLARGALTTLAPESPFAGVPFLLKDLLAPCGGVPMRCGCRFCTNLVPDHDGEIVRRYKAAGVLPLGRTNTPEMGLLPVTEPRLYGPTHNPWDLNRTPGGSSGGSAAAVAARIVPLAHGNDGGGSIRIPASCCGLFGFKPTRGRTPIGPDLTDAWQGMAVHHVVTLSVRDSAAMLDATAGPEPGALYRVSAPSRPFVEEVGRDPGTLRIAFTAKPLLGSDVHEDCVRGLEAIAYLCEQLGHDVEEAAPDIDGPALRRAMLTMIAGELRADIEQLEEHVGRRAMPRDFEPTTWALGLLGREITAATFARATRALHATGRQVAPFFETYDVLLTPTLAEPPVAIGALKPTGVESMALDILGGLNAASILNAVLQTDAVAGHLFDFMPYTPLANMTGQPAMSMPLAWNDDGLPIGMHFMGRFGDEGTLFRLAGQLEAAQPWFHRRPPLHGGA